MRFKKCFLHIGIEKTGSTTIQRYLEKNRDEIRKQGHYYPKCLGPYRGSHYYLVVYSRNDESFDDLRLVSGVTNLSELYDFRENLIINMDKEFNSTSDCDILHISCENFHSRLLGDSEIKKLKLLLDKYVDEFKVICYLRPQHEVALSLYSTDMKLGGIPKKPIPEVSSDTHYYNYSVFLNKWKEVFGAESIIIRNFQKHNLVNQNLLMDYLSVTGINKENLSEFENSNESLSPEGLLFLGMMNKHLPRFINNEPSGLRKNIADIFEKLFPGGGAITSRSEACCFYSKFIDSNNIIKDNLFTVDFSKYPEEYDFSEMEVDQLISLIVVFLKNIKPINQFSDCKLNNLFLVKDKIDFNFLIGYFFASDLNFDSSNDVIKWVSEVWKSNNYIIDME